MYIDEKTLRILATINSEQWEAIITMANYMLEKPVEENSTQLKKIGVEGLEVKVHRMLQSIGLLPKLIGYRCLYHAIMLVYEDESYIRNMNEKLYPNVAEKCGITSCRVEGAMRYAIEKALKNADENVCKKIFVGKHFTSRGKITNGHFIAAAVSYLKVNG